MSEQFKVSATACGDLSVRSGFVIDASSGAASWCGQAPPAPTGDGISAGTAVVKPATEATAENFLGGSGWHVRLTGAHACAGLYSYTAANTWTNGAFRIDSGGASAAYVLWQDSDQLATGPLVAGNGSLVGAWAATAYGASLYGTATGGTIGTSARDAATQLPRPSALVSVSGSRAQGGLYTTADGLVYVSAEDAAWSLVIASDGSAELIRAGYAVATRSSGGLLDPSGHFTSNTGGEVWGVPGGLPPAAPTDTDGAANPFGTLSVDLEPGAGVIMAAGVGSLLSRLTIEPFTNPSIDSTYLGGAMCFDLAAAWEAGEISDYVDLTLTGYWFTWGDYVGATLAYGTVPLRLIYGGTTMVVPVLAPVGYAYSLLARLRLHADGQLEVLAGAPWSAEVRVCDVPPRAGWVSVILPADSEGLPGDFSPHFTPALPTLAAGEKCIPLAKMSGSGPPAQIHTGVILRKGGGGGGEPWIAITLYDYLALSEAEQAAGVYDITDFTW